MAATCSGYGSKGENIAAGICLPLFTQWQTATGRAFMSLRPTPLHPDPQPRADGAGRVAALGRTRIGPRPPRSRRPRKPAAREFHRTGHSRTRTPIASSSSRTARLALPHRSRLVSNGCSISPLPAKARIEVGVMALWALEVSRGSGQTKLLIIGHGAGRTVDINAGAAVRPRRRACHAPSCRRRSSSSPRAPQPFRVWPDRSPLRRDPAAP